jgi:hypothetical protein
MVKRVAEYYAEVPYYRFSIDFEQQNTLFDIAGRIRNRVFIGYTSPAFYKLEDLYNHFFR